MWALISTAADTATDAVTIWGIPVHHLANGGIGLVFLIVILHILLYQQPAERRDIKAMAARFAQAMNNNMTQFRAETLEMRIADEQRYQEAAAVYKDTLDRICDRHEAQCEAHLRIIQVYVESHPSPPPTGDVHGEG